MAGATTNLSGLQTGETVVASGTKASNGSIDVTAVRASAQGSIPSAGAGGFTGPGG